MNRLFLMVFIIAAATSCGTKPGEAATDGTAAPINVNGLNPSANPAQPATVPAQTTPVTTTTNPAATVSTPAGINPPHGQPGHRCDIADGAPLNSAPKTTVSTPTISSSPTITQAITPTITQAPAAKTAAGMNPAHGQPGHRCDIPVGEPLNSKPAAATPVTTSTTPTVGPTVPASNNVVTTVSPVTTTPAAKTKTAPGMNPPHGEPGHRCEIAVGAPLNSEPTGPVIRATKTDSAKQ